MKKYRFITTLICLLAVISVNAQETDTTRNNIGVVDSNGRKVVVISGSDTDKQGFSLNVAGINIDFEKKKQTKNKPRIKYNVGTFEFGFIGLTKPSYSMYTAETPKFMELNNGKSISFSFDACVLSISSRNRRSPEFMIGLRLKWDDYVFSERYTIVKQDGMVQPRPIPEEMNRYKKSKLNTFAFNIPLAVKYKFSSGLSISGGVYTDLVLKQHTKVKFPKEKHKGDFGVNFFQAGVKAQIGYRQFHVFATYGLTPLFKSGVGPKTHPFSIGFGIW